MRRSRKIIVWGLGVLIALAGFCVALAIVIVKSGLFQEWLRARILREIERVTGGRAELAGFELDLRAMQARLDGFALHGTEAPAQGPLFRASSIRVEFKILSLIRPAADLRSVTIEHPEIRLIVYADGHTNLPQPRVRPRKGAVEQLLELAVDRFEISDGLLLWQDQRFPLRARGQGLRTSWSYDFSKPQYLGEVSLLKLYASLPGLKEIPVECDLKLRLDRKRLEFTALRLALPGVTFRAQGALENWAAPQAQLDYAARLSLPALANALGLEGVPRRGEIALEGRARLGAGEYLTGGRLRAWGLAHQTGFWDVASARASADFYAARDGLKLRNLTIWLLGGRLRGTAVLGGWRVLKLDGRLEQLLMDEVARAARRPTPPFQGYVSGPFSAKARLEGAKLEDWSVTGLFQISPAPGLHPVSGQIDARYQSRPSRLEFGPSHVDTPGSRARWQGVWGREMEVSFECTDAGEMSLMAGWLDTGAERLHSLQLDGGALSFRGALRGTIQSPRLEGRLSMRNFRWQGYAFNSLVADVSASEGALEVRRLRLQGEGLALWGTFSTGLNQWRPSTRGQLNANLKITARQASDLLVAAGRPQVVSGRLQAQVSLAGSWHEPRFETDLELSGGLVYRQPVEKLRVVARYERGTLEATSVEARIGAGTLRLSGVYKHEPADPASGKLSFKLAATKLPLSRLAGLGLPGGWDGLLEAETWGEIVTAGAALRLAGLNGRASLTGLSRNGQPLGALVATAQTSGSLLEAAISGKLLDSPVRGQWRCKLEGRYPAWVTVGFGRIRLAELLERLKLGEGARRLALDGSAEGKLTLEGLALEPRSWRGVLEIGSVELGSTKGGEGALQLALHNEGPVIVELTGRQARIRQARLVNQTLACEVAGALNLDSPEPLDLRVRGRLDMAALRGLDRRLRASGSAVLDTSVRGRVNEPDLYGRIQLQDASVNYGELPNGLDKLNGTILLQRDRATIEKLSAESGGGSVALAGFAALSDPPSFWLQLKGAGVRVRYPEGVSSTVNLTLAWAGTYTQSVLSGDVSVTRAAFHPQTDLGTMLARTAQTALPKPEHPLLANMRLDVRIRTAPQVRVETSLTRSLQVEADLRLRGSALRPGLLGRAMISQGEVLFFGNRYAIQTGEIVFADPARIEPVLNLNLQTRVRGVEVALNINGPLNKASVTYRSDPPLSFSDIVSLLATGRAPVTSPGLVGARSEFAQSWEQAGAGALVSQAITSPLAGRLQRFLGVSRLKIDPTVRGIENTPAANLTLEQQIGPDVTLVYITNLARAQQQTIRLEWDFTRNFSALAVREANGFFGVDFLYKRRFK